MSLKGGGESALSASFQSLSMYGFKEFLAGLLLLVRRLVVADFVSELVKYFKADAGFQIVFGMNGT